METTSQSMTTTSSSSTTTSVTPIKASSTSPSPPPATTTSSKSMASPKLCSPSSSPSSSSSSSLSPSNPLSSTVKSPSTDSKILAQKEHEISKLVEEIQRLREKIKTMQHDKPTDGGGVSLPEEDLDEPETPVSPSSCNNLSPMQLNTKSLSSTTTPTSNTTTTLTSISGHLHHPHHHHHQTDLLTTSGPLNFHHHGPLDSLILAGGGVGDRSSSGGGNPLSSLNTNALIGGGGGGGTNLITMESQHRSLEGSLQKLQEALRQNVDKFMNESLNTGNISRCVRELLSIHNIGQRLFARFVLGLSQGTVSELLSKPKPWDKLTEKGRDSYRKMHAWAADENCINLLKSLVPRKGKETTSFKQDDPAAEEKIRQILIEAQGAMVTPSIRTNSGSGLLRNQVGSGLTGLSNGEIIGPLGLIKSDKMTTSIIGIGGGLAGIGLGGGNRGGGVHHDDDSDSDSERSTPGGGRSPTPLITSSSAHLHSSSSNNAAMDLATGLSATSNHLSHHNSSSLVNSNSPSGLLSSLRSGNNNSNSKQNSSLSESDEQLSHDMVARIYQEELAKLIGQQVEEGFRHPHGMAFDRNPDQIRQAFTIYHQELSRLHQLVSSGAAAAAAAGVGHINSPAAAAAAAAAATDPEVFARLAAASLVNGAGYLGLPHLLPGLNLPSSRSPSRGGTGNGADGKGSPEPGRESISPRDLHHHQRLSSSPSSSSPPPSSHLANNLSTSNGGVTNLSSSANHHHHHSRSTPTSPEIDSPPPHRSSSTSSQQTSAFSLVRPKLEPGSKQQSYSPTSAAAVAAAAAAAAAAAVAGLPVGLDMGSNGSTSSSTSSTTPTNMTTGHGVNHSNSVANNGPSSVGAEDLSASASPLQRMQSITNSLLSQSSVPPVSSTPSRPSKAVLPPITQNQFDHYNNLNTEDIVKKVKEQLSQYSISQRLFGESVLGLSQGSVSDLLARPKPWHMLTQKGREPFIRMKMFLEDDNAVHKLVASQYKIAPEKLMRTGGYAGTPMGQTGSGTTVASLVIGAGGSINMSSGGLANMSGVTSCTPSTVTAPTTPSSHHHHHTATLSPNHGNTASIINTSGSVKGSPSSVSSVSAKLLTDSVVGRTDLTSSLGSRSSPVYGNGSSASTPEHTPNATLISANQSPPRGSSNYLKRRYDGSTLSTGNAAAGSNNNSGNSNNNGNGNERSGNAAGAGVSYIQPSVYEMAAITQDFDTAAITTKIKETLMAHNIGQKIFGEIVLGLSQGSVSELLSKPKPWPMLSIKGREPFIRMHIWLTDTRNIERLQAIKNERREMNKKRRINGDEVSSISSTKSTSSSNHISLHVDPNNPSLHHHLTTSSSTAGGGGGGNGSASAHLHGSSMFNSNNNNNNSSSPSSFRSSSGNQLYLQGSNANSGLGSGSINCSSPFGLSSANASGSSAKKPRILFTSKQKEALKLAFSMDAYPSTATMEFLAAELDLSIRTITNWFHNHRMRLKQVPNPSSNSGNINTITEEGNNGSSSSTSLPYNMGRDGMTFDPITFRVALSQRMADLDLTGDESGGGGHHSSKRGDSYSALNLGSSSNNYYNPNSCSSPASSSYQEDEMGTLDLSMPSKSHHSSSERRSSSGKTSNNHHLYSMSGNRSEVTEDSDDSETGSLEDSSSSRRHHLHHRHLSSRHHHGKNTTTTITMNPISSSAGHPSGELDLSSRSGSTISVTIASTGVSVRPAGNNQGLGTNVSSKVFTSGSSRRKPAIVTSSSSRRKPAMPQWVAPNIDCFGDDEEDDVDHDHHRRNHSRPNRRSIRRSGDHQDDETPFSTGSETEDEEDLRRVNRRHHDEDDDDEDDIEEAEPIMITRVNVNPVNQEPIRRRSSIGSNASDTNNATISVNIVNHPNNNHLEDDTNDSGVKNRSTPPMTTTSPSSIHQQQRQLMDDDDEDKTDQEFADDDDYIDSDLVNNSNNEDGDLNEKSADQSKQNKSKVTNGQEIVLNGINEDEPEPMITNEAELEDDEEDDREPASSSSPTSSKVNNEMVTKGHLMTSGNSIGDEDEQIHSESSTDL